jgi:bifunctional UDP-N-acetylglucosamine pyrophosphorylase / glucosamine-1-phosphate N-acetyltransferase
MMNKAKTIAVILAAGKGTRLKSSRAKVLHRVGGLSLIEHAVRACQALDVVEILVVVGHQADEVAAVVRPMGACTVVQHPQNGTGGALLAAREAIGDRARFALVLPGDAPLIQTETLAALLHAHHANRARATLLSAVLPDPTDYGRILRDEENCVTAIVEEKAASAEQRNIHEINSSIYCFTLEKLWPCLKKVGTDNAHKEVYLTDAIALLKDQGEQVEAMITSNPGEILGCNTRGELADVDRVFRRRKVFALMDAGVTIYLPETVLVDADVEVGRDTVIEPCTQLLGKTTVGEDCFIGTGSVLSDAVVANSVEIKPHSLVLSSRLGPGSGVGPFAHVRNGSELRESARVGNFVEVKKSKLGEGVKAMHLTYIGDATVGRQTNIGAGTITCNYDGVRKNPTTIGQRVFVGSGTELVAPVTVGDDVYIAAGSTITDDVPAGALAIARSRQSTKPGWVHEHRAKRTAAAASTVPPGGQSAPEQNAEPSTAARPKTGRKRAAPPRKTRS